MPNISVVVPHKLSSEEALQRIRGLIGKVKAQFADRVNDLKEEWNGNNGNFSFQIMGFEIAGTLVVDASEARIQSTIPFALIPFKGKIESVIQEKASELLA